MIKQLRCASLALGSAVGWSSAADAFTGRDGWKVQRPLGT